MNTEILFIWDLHFVNWHRMNFQLISCWKTMIANWTCKWLYFIMNCLDWEQVNSFFFSWTFSICSFKWTFWGNFDTQRVHLNGFLPSCTVSIWAVNTLYERKWLFLHNLQHFPSRPRLAKDCWSTLVDTICFWFLRFEMSHVT